MSDRFVVDPPQLDLLLKQLRLPTMRALWRGFTGASPIREGWPTARLLAALASQEVTDRDAPARIERHRAEGEAAAVGKTHRQLRLRPSCTAVLQGARGSRVASGDTWLDEGANVLLFGPPGTGKSHLAAGLGLRLVENGFRSPLPAHGEPGPEAPGGIRRDLALRRGASRTALQVPWLLILDDFSYVTLGECGDQRALRTRRRTLREPLAPGDRQRALQRLGQDLRRRRHDAGRRRPPRPVRSHIFESSTSRVYRRRAAIAARQAAGGEPADGKHEGGQESG